MNPEQANNEVCMFLAEVLTQFLALTRDAVGVEMKTKIIEAFINEIIKNLTHGQVAAAIAVMIINNNPKAAT